MRIINIYILLFTLTMFTGCKETANDNEIKKMCLHLLELRKSTNIKTDINQCIKESKENKISKRAALCRISSVNTLEYFNRCRTGYAR
ncbi:MAG: hypothetical protein JXR91_11810 [Deltaproteobacteria bacterium]|nr:hypothetical protein [Deltaproteobacteria bacterium]